MRRYSPAPASIARSRRGWRPLISSPCQPFLGPRCRSIRIFFDPIEIDNRSVENLRAAWYPYTMPFNLTGNPAVSLHCGFDPSGMQLAILLIARPGEDERLLRAAAPL